MAITIISFILLLGLFAVRILGGWPTPVTLMEYQGATFYRRRRPLRDVGPGRRYVLGGIDKLIIVDTRPVQVSYEDQGVLMRDGALASYSISGSARVSDVRKALYSATNYNQVPAYVMLCCARRVLNECASFDLKGGREALSEQIGHRAKPRLEAAGFELQSFRLTRLMIGPRAQE